jgi:HK97 family phage prohead protease
MDPMERRTIPSLLELRTEPDDESGVMAGYAAVFNQEADIGGLWREKIRAGAFTDTLKRGDEVYALWNHDPSQVLARNTKSDGTRGGLRMHEDRSGLKVSIRPYDTPTGREVLTLVREGGIDKMSFAFLVEDEVWSRKDGMDIREITKVRLFDVSPVTFPAYSGTSISARAMEARAAFDASVDSPLVEPEPLVEDPSAPTEPEPEPLVAAMAISSDPIPEIPENQPFEGDALSNGYEIDPTETPAEPDAGAWEAELEAERLRNLEVHVHGIR